MLLQKIVMILKKKSIAIIASHLGSRAHLLVPLKIWKIFTAYISCGPAASEDELDQ